ncbi:hypothetical protein [Streptomyces zaomyceticus]|uniref:hypothetical protein n=1 Tax=Streptomyces zaomyceticus TaxID=68286 RepID=UPI0037954100
MGAHLFVVPDPEPDEAPGPGERPVLVPAPVIGPRTAPDLGATPAPSDDFPDEPAPQNPADPDEDHLRDHDVTGQEPGEWDEEDQDPEDDEDEDEAGEYDDEEVPARHSAMTIPDLRPYVDPRPLRDLGPLAVEAGKTAGPPLLSAIGRLLRDLGQMLAWYGRGFRVLLVLVAGWLSGKYGKRGSLGVRFGVVAFLVYAVVKLSGQYPYAPWILLALALAASAMAAMGAIEIPESKPTKKETGKGKGAKGKADQAPAKDKTAPTEDSPEGANEEAKEEPAEAPRASWATRLFRRPAARAEAPADPLAGTPDEDVEEAPEESPEGVQEEAPEEVEEAPVETPHGPSREDVIRSLHTLVGGGRGVLLTALCAHLSLPDTRAVKRVLEEAGITTRQGVRTVAGNGPGVHRDDFPELPSSQESPQGAGVVAGQAANANANNAANAAGERADPGWTAEDLERGWRWLQDPDRSPSAWKIQKLQ